MAMEASDLHQRVESAFNAGDVDALVDLYESDACLIGENGDIASGLDAIREVWQGFTSFGGRIQMTTRYAVELGDLALLSNAWTFDLDGAGLATSLTAEVARRQANGSWRYVIDNPYGGSGRAQGDSV
jgi:ketosteroid isomerase-like protein